MKTRIMIAAIKSWNLENALRFKKRHSGRYDISIVRRNVDLNYRKVAKFNPRYIFFPHWSWLIPKDIFNNFECVVFHMTDLPFGRGGSPLQNLIARGINKTKISAVKVEEGLDAGPLYMKKNLRLNGRAEDIYKRASDIIFHDMIPRIAVNKLRPASQKGKVLIFRRRLPSEGDISGLHSAKKIYDWIRMLDAEGYPPAFLETKGLKIEFSGAKRNGENITADAKIKVKK